MTRWQNLIRQDNDEEMSFETQYILVVCHKHMPEACLPFSNLIVTVTARVVIYNDMLLIKKTTRYYVYENI